MSMSIVKAREGDQYIVEVLEMRFREYGVDNLLKTLCSKVGGTSSFIEWHQGVCEGFGAINYLGQKIEIYWTDFLNEFDFFCPSLDTAKALAIDLEEFFYEESAS